eukprot:scaffold8360_cov122-Isochrysis_galbana.AAC.5
MTRWASRTSREECDGVYSWSFDRRRGAQRHAMTQRSRGRSPCLLVLFSQPHSRPGIGGWGEDDRPTAHAATEARATHHRER